MRVIQVISTSKDADGNLLVKFLRNGKDDVQETMQVTPFGIFGNPIGKMVGVHEETAVMGDSFVLGFIQQCKAEPGEAGLYSVNAEGTEQTFIWLKNNGEIWFGGNEGNLTEFGALKTGFDQLKNDFNSFVNTFNTHVHPTPSGTSSPTPTPATASSASIDNAKLEKLLTA